MDVLLLFGRGNWVRSASCSVGCMGVQMKGKGKRVNNGRSNTLAKKATTGLGLEEDGEPILFKSVVKYR